MNILQLIEGLTNLHAEYGDQFINVQLPNGRYLNISDVQIQNINDSLNADRDENGNCYLLSINTVDIT